MLPKKQRASKKTIDEIIKNGSFVNSPNLTLKYYINKGLKSFQVSFVAPKGVSKRAVDRNFLKRVGYKALKNIEKSIPEGFVGMFVFNKKNSLFLLSHRNKNKDLVTHLEAEIKDILSKI